MTVWSSDIWDRLLLCTLGFVNLPLLMTFSLSSLFPPTACAFRYNGLSFVYLIYLLLIPLFSEPTKTTMQGKRILFFYNTELHSLNVFCWAPWDGLYPTAQMLSLQQGQYGMEWVSNILATTQVELYRSCLWCMFATYTANKFPIRAS